MKLLNYYLSSTSFRLRIALHYKSLDFDYIPIDIHLPPAERYLKNYKDINPMHGVPVLIDGNYHIAQSMAILEYLEEKYPLPSLLPQDIYERGVVRSLANLIACDIHPLNNLSTLNYLTEIIRTGQDERRRWYHHWLERGFIAIEQTLKSNHSRGKYCIGDKFTLADCCLIPQAYNAIRHHYPIDNHPLIQQIYEHGLKLPFISLAMPENQMDAGS
jgi:maleylacetoacetate isomerase